MLGLCCCSGFSLVVAAGGYALAAVSQLLLLQSTGSAVEAHRLSSSLACGICPDQASNLCLLHWQVDSLPLCHQGNPGTQSLN